MAVECFCGCGRKVKLTRRAVNGTGALVQGRLDVWAEREEDLHQAGAWTPGLEAYLESGAGIAAEMQAMTHGGPLRVTTSQREITEWLNRSTELLKEVAAGDTSGIADLPEPEPDRNGPVAAEEGEGTAPAPPIDKEARRAEIEAIRASYEAGGEEENTCPECGAVIPDPGEYLAHVSSEHPAG